MMLQKNGESGKNSKLFKQETIVHREFSLLFSVLETNHYERIATINIV